ncbi:putative DNA helicase [Helianthus anomalus]
MWQFGLGGKLDFVSTFTILTQKRRDPDLIRVTNLSNSDSIYSLSHNTPRITSSLPETLNPKILILLQLFFVDPSFSMARLKQSALGLRREPLMTTELHATKQTIEVMSLLWVEHWTGQINPDLEMELKLQAQPLPYQQNSLSKMFGNGIN